MAPTAPPLRIRPLNPMLQSIETRDHASSIASSVSTGSHLSFHRAGFVPGQAFPPLDNMFASAGCWSTSPSDIAEILNGDWAVDRDRETKYTSPFRLYYRKPYGSPKRLRRIPEEPEIKKEGFASASWLAIELWQWVRRYTKTSDKDVINCIDVIFLVLDFDECAEMDEIQKMVEPDIYGAEDEVDNSLPGQVDALYEQMSKVHKESVRYLFEDFYSRLVAAIPTAAQYFRDPVMHERENRYIHEWQYIWRIIVGEREMLIIPSGPPGPADFDTMVRSQRAAAEAEIEKKASENDAFLERLRLSASKQPVVSERIPPYIPAASPSKRKADKLNNEEAWGDVWRAINGGPPLIPLSVQEAEQQNERMFEMALNASMGLSPPPYPQVTVDSEPFPDVQQSIEGVVNDEHADAMEGLEHIGTMDTTPARDKGLPPCSVTMDIATLSPYNPPTPIFGCDGAGDPLVETMPWIGFSSIHVSDRVMRDLDWSPPPAQPAVTVVDLGVGEEDLVRTRRTSVTPEPDVDGMTTLRRMKKDAGRRKAMHVVATINKTWETLRDNKAEWAKQDEAYQEAEEEAKVIKELKESAESRGGRPSIGSSIVIDEVITPEFQAVGLAQLVADMGQSKVGPGPPVRDDAQSKRGQVS